MISYKTTKVKTNDPIKTAKGPNSNPIQKFDKISDLMDKIEKTAKGADPALRTAYRIISAELKSNIQISIDAIERSERFEDKKILIPVLMQSVDILIKIARINGDLEDILMPIAVEKYLECQFPNLDSNRGWAQIQANWNENVAKNLLDSQLMEIDPQTDPDLVLENPQIIAAGYFLAAAQYHNKCGQWTEAMRVLNQAQEICPSLFLPTLLDEDPNSATVLRDFVMVMREIRADSLRSSGRQELAIMWAMLVHRTMEEALPKRMYLAEDKTQMVFTLWKMQILDAIKAGQPPLGEIVRLMDEEAERNFPPTTSEHTTYFTTIKALAEVFRDYENPLQRPIIDLATNPMVFVTDRKTGMDGEIIDLTDNWEIGQWTEGLDKKKIN